MNKQKPAYLGCVNPPIYQASTFLFDKVEDLSGPEHKYARAGTETNWALEAEITKLEKAYKTIVTPSGLAAITSSILALVEKGDHMILAETIYGPTRIFCDNMLKKFGVEVTYCKADIGVEIKELITDKTKVIFLESPSSLTYQIQEISEIVVIAKAHKITTIIDNSWSAGYLFKPLDHGIDISVQSGSKYLSGHSDVLIGSISIKEPQLYDKIWQEYYQLGHHASPQDCYLAMRGLRTLPVRLKEHGVAALQIADFLQKRPEIERVIYPALPTFPQYDRYKKYFTAANGLLSFNLQASFTKVQIRNFINHLQIFKLGYSWGGFESLSMIYEVLPTPYHKLSAAPLIRFHVGIEGVELLKEDIDNALKKLVS
jgi:cystathionine beta-lyase